MAGSMAVTIELLAMELDQAIAIAHEERNAAAIVTAVQAKAKLFGLDVSKVNHEVTHDYAKMSDEELNYELATFIAEIRAAAGKPAAFVSHVPTRITRLISSVMKPSAIGRRKPGRAMTS